MRDHCLQPHDFPGLPPVIHGGQPLPVVHSALIPVGTATCGRDLLSVFGSSFLRGGVDLSLAGQIITTATIATFTEPLIHIEIGRIMACRTETPWGDLHRLPILMMKDHRHTMVCSANSCNGHRASPLCWGATHASCQFLAEAIPPLIEVWTENCGIDSTPDFRGMFHHPTPFYLVGSSTSEASFRHADRRNGRGIFQQTRDVRLMPNSGLFL
jgi:hypothetical protein